MAKINRQKLELDTAALQLRRTILHECDLLHIFLPRFCYHDFLSIAGNCRMCVVETNMSAKPVVACATVFSDNLEVLTDSFLVKSAREGILEFLLINHPLDCPICDQGGECDLQDQSMVFGSDRGRFFEMKRSVDNKYFSPLIKAIMTRCIHCTRCIRYANEILEEPLIGTLGRGMFTEIGNYVAEMFNSHIIGNISDVCPVGALTFVVSSYSYRSWELVGIDTIDALDSLCCNIRIDVRGNVLIRILPRLNPRINGEWITDEIRTSYNSLLADRLCFPMYRPTIYSPFERCSWQRAFYLVCSRVMVELKRSTRFSYFIGNGSDRGSVSLFKYLSSITAINNINSTFSMLVDFRSEYIVDARYLDDTRVDFYFYFGIYPKVESPILALRLRGVMNEDVFLKKIDKSLFIGSGDVVDYKLTHIDITVSSLEHLLKSDAFYCKFIEKKDDCLYLKGDVLSFFSETINRVTYLAYDLLDKKGIRVHFVCKDTVTVCLFEDAHGALNRSKTMFLTEGAPVILKREFKYWWDENSRTGFFMVEPRDIAIREGFVFVLAAQYLKKEIISYYKSKLLRQKESTPHLDFTFLDDCHMVSQSLPYLSFYNDVFDGSSNRFCVYIGPYSYLAELVGAHIVLPTNTFVEREGFYLNMLGFTQQTVRVVRLPVNLWSDEWVVLSLSLFLADFNPKVFCKKYMKQIFNNSVDCLSSCYSLSFDIELPLGFIKAVCQLRKSFGLPERHRYVGPSFRIGFNPKWAQKSDLKILIDREREKCRLTGEEMARNQYFRYKLKYLRLYKKWMGTYNIVVEPKININQFVSDHIFESFLSAKIKERNASLDSNACLSHETIEIWYCWAMSRKFDL
jgi:NADH dehydrogenase/NADH:ubiquinone oxidoreductase subunit G